MLPNLVFARSGVNFSQGFFCVENGGKYYEFLGLKSIKANNAWEVLINHNKYIINHIYSNFPKQKRFSAFSQYNTKLYQFSFYLLREVLPFHIITDA